MRTPGLYHPRTRLLATAAVALAALSLAACGNRDGSGVRIEGTAGPYPAPPAPAPAPKPHSGTTAAPTASVRKGATASAPHVPCTATTTKVTVQKVNRPRNHLLLTATNTGTRPCYAYSAPYLRFDEAQAATTVLRDSVPQAVVTLEPGQSADAAIGTESPQGTHGHQAHALGVLFANRAMNGGAGGWAHPKLPAGGVYVDSSAFVTYWQPNPADALVWTRRPGRRAAGPPRAAEPP
ncbi:DUF4232 domain-containing protein [Streptomyces sp. RGM 3693]|uniref:DUF4232 domain-containing protein n=1 Tax=Streptomyces sp. RGM 3693 TaxID=3413284 RepID=UPI003D291072